MMIAFAWAVGIGGDRKGRREELLIEESCLLVRIYLSLILLIFCGTSILCEVYIM